ncbi:hypothetical protein [Nonomuraea coxensis]|uniref:hypothetical protein n=1 Tax=Nonomuraea coxensis TaxID=404386 RepID=UPI00036E2A44|nr:hypothetical protein [Nonomuraea coxensis]
MVTFELKVVDDSSPDVDVEVHVIRSGVLMSISRIKIHGNGVPELASDEYWEYWRDNPMS